MRTTELAWWVQAAAVAVLAARHHASKPCLTHSPALRTQLVRASFFGVGAPEAFVIAIVSLLVFGPKGLAEVCA
jgi:hypothetical protein